MKDNNPDILGFRLKNTAAQYVIDDLKEIQWIADEFCKEYDRLSTITSNWSTFRTLYSSIRSLAVKLEMYGVEPIGHDFRACEGLSETLQCHDEFLDKLDLIDTVMKEKVSGMQILQDDAAMFLLDKLCYLAHIYDLAFTQYKKDHRIELSYQQLHDICHIASDLEMKLEGFEDLSSDVFVEQDGPIMSL